MRTRMLKGLGRETLCVGLYAGLSALATYPLILHLRTQLPAGGDSSQNYWNLWWAKRAILELHTNPYFTSDLYFPYGATLYFHTLNLLPSVLALPLTVTTGLTSAYNFLVFLAFTLSGYGMYRLTLYVLRRELGVPRTDTDLNARLGAFLAGMAFTFSSYHFVHLMGHLDLASTEWLPFYVLFLLKTRAEPGWRNPVLCGLCLAATMLTASYYVLFLLVFTAMLIGHMIVTREGGWRPALQRIGAAFAVFGAIVSPILVPMLIRGRTEGRGFDPAADVDRYSADLLGFVIPSIQHAALRPLVTPLYERIMRLGGTLEVVVFLGYGAMGLAALALATLPRLRRFWPIPIVGFILLALGPVAHIGGYAILPALSFLTPFFWLSHLPYGDIPRVPGRFVVMVILCVSILAGCGAWALFRGRRTATAVGLSIAFGVLMLFETSVVPIPLQSVQAPPFFARLAADPINGAVLEVPIPNDPAVFPSRMLFQTVHGKPVYGGYLSRGVPPLPFDAIPGFSQFKTLSDRIDDIVPYDPQTLVASSRAVLGVYGARHVVIEKSLMAKADEVERARRLADRLFGEPAREFEDGSTLAYLVPQVTTPPPLALWLDSGWFGLERSRTPGEEELKWRWMGEESRLGVLTPERAIVRLRLAAQALKHARRLQISRGDVPLTTLQISSSRATYETTPFELPAGLSVLSLRSLDGTDVPRPDRRSLSVSVFRLELEIHGQPLN